MAVKTVPWEISEGDQNMELVIHTLEHNLVSIVILIILQISKTNLSLGMLPLSNQRWYHTLLDYSLHLGLNNH